MLPEVQTSSAEVTVRVTEAMTAVLDGKPIHPVFSTFWLTYYAEVAARKAIEPYFETGENAVGASVELRHEAMVAVGRDVLVRATVVEVRGAKIVCTIEAFCNGKRFAVGTQTQIVMMQTKIDELLNEAGAI